MKKIITSEFCSYGHPDKLADQISDNLLDALIAEDEDTRAGIEVMVKDNMVVLGGEVSTNAYTNYENEVRRVFEDVVYPDDHKLNPSNIKIINLIGVQSREIANAVDMGCGEIGAGDQGFMVGFASNETDEYMPLGVYMARKIGQYVATMEGIGPDVKTQVVVEYDSGKSLGKVKHITISAMHNGIEELKEAREIICNAVKNNDMRLEYAIFSHQIKNNPLLKISINPAGSWMVGGPISDCGMTGRKIVVDQYGGYCNVGGGAFSGKDMTKVDRSAAYLARYFAKNIVATGLFDTAKVELSYEIGRTQPTSLNITTTGYEGALGEFVDVALKNHITKEFDLTPKGIICRFGKEPYNYESARNGHFGFEGDEYRPWEYVDVADNIREYITKKEEEIAG